MAGKIRRAMGIWLSLGGGEMAFALTAGRAGNQIAKRLPPRRVGQRTAPGRAMGLRKRRRDGAPFLRNRGRLGQTDNSSRGSGSLEATRVPKAAMA